VTKLSFVVRSVCFALALSGVASAAAPEDRGPEINPYECLGRYEAATGNRSMTQVRAELEKRLHPLFEGDEPHTVKAMKLCVVAMLESRLGDNHAAEHYAGAVAEAPEEPGYELWYGMLYSNFRGARGIVVEPAEDHFYKGLEKIDALKKAGKFRDYHQVVEEWIHKRLLVTYQEDGLPLLPWKAYAQHGYAGHDMPGASLMAQLSVSKDTRDFFRNNEMRLFTGELMFANGPYRALGKLTKAQIYDIARAPLRYRHEERLRLRHNLIGALDVSFAQEKLVKGQIDSYYLPPPTTGSKLSDVDVQELGLGFERVIPLYPVLDFKLAGGVKHIDRQGVIEFDALTHEKFWLYEARPSFSRFIGPDKITLDLVYVYMNVTDVPFGVKADAQRAKYIRAANLEYALYTPLVLPEFRNGELGMHRTPTRGWYFNAGAADDDDVYGTKTVTRRDFYLGTRFEGAGNYDLSLQGTYSTSSLTGLDPNTGTPDNISPPIKSTSFRTTAIIQRRIINPDAIPGINGSFLAPDMLNLVVPITWDKGLSGSSCKVVTTDPMSLIKFNEAYTPEADCYKTYENVRVGAEIWAKFFGTGFLGPSFLTTVGYDYQYFYNIKKAFHEVHLNLRMGWGKL
jgi:hypothetical protein